MTAHIPEFTAEASLDTTKERYRLAYFPTSITDGNKVVAAGLVCQCYLDPIFYCVCHQLFDPLRYPTPPPPSMNKMR
jgi:hypothetical protein